MCLECCCCCDAMAVCLGVLTDLAQLSTIQRALTGLTNSGVPCTITSLKLIGATQAPSSTPVTSGAELGVSSKRKRGTKKSGDISWTGQQLADLPTAGPVLRRQVAVASDGGSCRMEAESNFAGPNPNRPDDQGPGGVHDPILVDSESDCGSCVAQAGSVCGSPRM